REPLSRRRRAGDRDRARVGIAQPCNERKQRRLARAAAADDREPPPNGNAELDAVQHASAAQHSRNSGSANCIAATAQHPTRFNQQLRQPAPFAGITRIRFGGYALGSALSAPHTGAPRFQESSRTRSAWKSASAGRDVGTHLGTSHPLPFWTNLLRIPWAG